MSPLMSIYLFCFQQVPVSIDMISVIIILFYQSSSFQNKFSTFYYLSWGYITFCSNEPHFGHGVNYYVSKRTAEHILKHSEFLFIRNTIRNSRYSFSHKSHFMRNEI